MGLFKSPVVLLVLCLISPQLAFGKSIGGQGTPVVGRDWKLHPAIVDLPQPEELYALGDVHGDCDRMIQVLAAAKLIAEPSASAPLKWTGGKADLVLTGDMIDKYTQSMRVLAALRELEPQVTRAGG